MSLMVDRRAARAPGRRPPDAMGALRVALGRLGTIDDHAELLPAAAALACTLGFERAIVSTIVDGTWLPQAVEVVGDPCWAREILAAGRRAPAVLGPDLLESALLTRQLPMRVEHVQDDPHVNRHIADASRSTSYIVAPLVAGGTVIGFVHADRYFSQQPLSERDADVLAVYAGAVALALSRAGLLERLARIRELTDLGGVAPPAVRHQGGRQPLTGREIEVAELMAAGHGNQAIARLLVVTDETVKSHVKHVYMKLGARTRAEAVALWLRGNV